MFISAAFAHRTDLSTLTKLRYSFEERLENDPYARFVYRYANYDGPRFVRTACCIAFALSLVAMLVTAFAAELFRQLVGARDDGPVPYIAWAILLVGCLFVPYGYAITLTVLASLASLWFAGVMRNYDRDILVSRYRFY